MRLVSIVTLFALLAPATAIAAPPPLDDGTYTRGRCSDGSDDILESFDIQTIMEGRQKGSRYLYPAAEKQEGGCIASQFMASGDRYAGSAKCEGGGSRIQYSTGTYRFSLQVLNRREFISKGRKYVWCAAHR